MSFVKAQLTGAEYAKLRTGKTPAAAKRAIRRAVTSIVRAVAKEAKAKIRTRTGLLAKSMGSVVRTYPGTDRTVGLAGPRKGFATTLSAVAAGKKTKLRGLTVKGKSLKLKGRASLAGKRIDPRKYAHLVEFGHKKGEGRSAAPAYPYLSPAAAGGSQQAKATITRVLAEEIRGAL